MNKYKIFKLEYLHFINDIKEIQHVPNNAPEYLNTDNLKVNNLVLSILCIRKYMKGEIKVYNYEIQILSFKKNIPYV